MKNLMTNLRMTLIPPKTKKSYGEENQKKRVLFAFCNKVDDTSFQQIHTQFDCRDFLGDCLYATQKNKPFGKYRFTFDPKVEKLDTDKTRLAVFADPSSVEENLSLLHDAERRAGVPATQIVRIDENTLIFEGDPMWMSSIYMISLYSFLIKCLYYKKDPDKTLLDSVLNSQTNESTYIRQVGLGNLEKILANLGRISSFEGCVTGYNAEVPPDTSQIHHYSGWVSLSVPAFKERNGICRMVNRLLAA